MGWESGAGLFSNLGGMFSGIGQGEGGFMGDFGTGEGTMAGWSPFQNVKEGQGLFGKEGGFGSGQGQIGQMLGGGQQDVTSPEGSDASNQTLVDDYNARFQDVTGEDASGVATPNILDIVKGINQNASNPPLHQPYESPLGNMPGSPDYTGEGWANTPDAVTNTNESLSQQPENQGVKDYNARFGQQGSGIGEVDPSALAQIQEYQKGPKGIGQGGDRFMGKFGTGEGWFGQKMPKLFGGFQGPDFEGGNVGDYVKGVSEGTLESPMASGLHKAGGFKGLLMTALGAGAGTAGGMGEGDTEGAGATGVDQPQYDPLQLYGGGAEGGGGNWADVTGSNYLQDAQYNPLSQGLAGYYNPKLRELR